MKRHTLPEVLALSLTELDWLMEDADRNGDWDEGERAGIRAKTRETRTQAEICVHRYRLSQRIEHGGMVDRGLVAEARRLEAYCEQEKAAFVDFTPKAA